MIAYWVNLDKYCAWSDTLGKVFNSYEEAKTYCNKDFTCIGFSVVEGIWRSCPLYSPEKYGKGSTLYKKGNFESQISDGISCILKPQLVVKNLDNISVFLGCLLSEHVLMGKNEICNDGRGYNTTYPANARIPRIRNENECKVAAELIWTRCDIQFNVISNAKFPTGCYVYQAELTPEVETTFYNHASNNNVHEVSAPICRWQEPKAVGK